MTGDNDGKTGKEDESEIGRLVDEVISYMSIIKKKLIGDDFSSMEVKMYNIETYEYETCPECGKPRKKFFLLLQPGDNLFDLTSTDRVIRGYKVFCLDCTKHINVLPPSFRNRE